MASASGAPAAAEALRRRRRILCSRLNLDDVPSSKAPVVYSPAYDISFDGLEKQHPFDSSKWGRVRGFLEDAGLLQDDRIVEPLEASEDDLLVVHSESYLNSLQSSEKVARIVEVPAVALLPNLLVQQKLLYPFRKQVGGSVLSAKLALERGWAINIGGGFHHCSAEEGGGFCAYADISLVMIIDLDAHQGNGHEKDFGGDGRVYTLDMYNSGIYPFDHVAKKYIDQKVELDSGTKTDDYLENLDKALKVAESRFQPQLIVYNAGTDILDGDPLGRLKVSPEGVAIRDEKVFRLAKDQSIPLLMLTSGGYMKSSARVIADSIINPPGGHERRRRPRLRGDGRGGHERRRRRTGASAAIRSGCGGGSGGGTGLDRGNGLGRGCRVEFDENSKVATITHVPLPKMESYCIPALGGMVHRKRALDLGTHCIEIQ